MPTKVLLDTNVLKFSATKLERLIPVNRKIKNWYGRVIGFQFYELGYINPNERIQNPELRREADLLPQVAELAKRGELELLMHKETSYESWGLPNMNSATGTFYDAPITDAEAPIKYGRALFYPGFSADDLTKLFLSRIKNKRFKELTKITGGYQGGNNYNLNQLLDAFYIWCAEHNGCDYMLTLDFKLIKVVRNNTNYNVRIKLIKPSELLKETGHLRESEKSLKATSYFKRLFRR